MDALVAMAHVTSRGEAGRLAIGFYAPLSAGNLRATVLDFRQRFPQMQLGMVERSGARLVAGLCNIALDRYRRYADS